MKAILVPLAILFVLVGIAVVVVSSDGGGKTVGQLAISQTSESGLPGVIKPLGTTSCLKDPLKEPGADQEECFSQIEAAAKGYVDEARDSGVLLPWDGELTYSVDWDAPSTGQATVSGRGMFIEKLSGEQFEGKVTVTLIWTGNRWDKKDMSRVASLAPMQFWSEE